MFYAKLGLASSISLFPLPVDAVRITFGLEGNSGESTIAPARAIGKFSLESNDPLGINYNVVNFSDPSLAVIYTESPPFAEDQGSFVVTLEQPGTYGLQAQARSNNILETTNVIVVVALSDSGDSDGSSSSSSGSLKTTQRNTATTSEPHLVSARLSTTTNVPTTTIFFPCSLTGMRTYTSNVSWCFGPTTVIPTSVLSTIRSSHSTPTASSSQSSISAPSSSGSRNKRIEQLVGSILGGILVFFLLLALIYYVVCCIRRKQGTDNGGTRNGDADGEPGINTRKRPWYAIGSLDRCRAAKPSILPFTQMESVSHIGFTSNRNEKGMMVSNGIAISRNTIPVTPFDVDGPSANDSNGPRLNPDTSLAEDCVNSDIKPNLAVWRGALDTANSPEEITLSLIVNVGHSVNTSHPDKVISPPLSRQATPPPSYRSSTGFPRSRKKQST
ncbi:hypothetical protein J3R30DRAFT_3427219 [Lentinula aciculospora]|uniref:Uncharacterized protein n=1 Tax=Lentinula aciculospora TaxID=153920 RepID=A0A9W9AUK9_9AGAR|nr:hypothetical protein J3R30DRAFT_3427219 [Lentinula aciculospora]